MSAAEYADDPTAMREERLWLAEMRGEAVAHVRARDRHLYLRQKQAEVRAVLRGTPWNTPTPGAALGVRRASDMTIAERARDALRHIATDPKCCVTLSLTDRDLCFRLANVADDRTLDTLGRLLR